MKKFLAPDIPLPSTAQGERLQGDYKLDNGLTNVGDCSQLARRVGYDGEGTVQRVWSAMFRRPRCEYTFKKGHNGGYRDTQEMLGIRSLSNWTEASGYNIFAIVPQKL